MLLLVTLLLSPAHAMTYDTCKVAVESSLLIDNTIETQPLKEIIEEKVRGTLLLMHSMLTREQRELVNSIPGWQLPRGIKEKLERVLHWSRAGSHPLLDTTVCSPGYLLDRYYDEGDQCVPTTGVDVPFGAGDDIARVEFGYRGYYDRDDKKRVRYDPGIEMTLWIGRETVTYPVDMVRGKVIGDYLAPIEDLPPSPPTFTKPKSEIVATICDPFKDPNLVMATPEEWAANPGQIFKKMDVDAFYGKPSPTYQPKYLGNYVVVEEAD